MLDITKILKRSWHILWNYRTLWIFGFILALAVGGHGGGNGGGSSSSGSRNNPESTQQAPGDWNWEGLNGATPREKLNDALRQAGTKLQELQAAHPVEFQMGINLAITLLIVIVIFSLVAALLRYVAEAATIRMVDEYEQTGVKVGFRQGWKYGWSRSAWRLFLVNFLVNLPRLGFLVVLGLMIWWIVSAALSGVEAALVTSLIAGIGLIFLACFLTIILMVVLYLVRDLAWRMVVIEGAGVNAALSGAWAMVRRQWKNVGLMWLVMIGLQIAWGLVFFILFIPLLVVSVFTALGGLLTAIVPTLLTAGVASLLSVPGYWPWAFAAIIGLPFFAVVAFSPIALVSGWGLIYQSNVWTLTYRELKALETVAPVLIEAQ